jgi:Tfp pilus assembly protein PilO
VRPEKDAIFDVLIAQKRTKNGPLYSIAMMTEHDDRAQDERKLEQAQWLYCQLVADCSTLAILKSYLDDIEVQLNALLNQSPDSAS